MRFFEASIGTVVIRFYLMMAIVIGSFFAGVPWLAILALPMLLSAMLAVSFGKNNTSKKARPITTTNKSTQMAGAQQAA